MTCAQTRKMISPLNEDLMLTLFIGNEGFNYANEGVESYEGIMLMKEFVNHFSCEKNSDFINESEKLQRDVSPKDPRVKKMVKYVQKGASIFPSITVFLTKLTIEKSVKVGNRDMVVACLSKDTDRHITDGQGRHTTASGVLALEGIDLDQLNDFANHTISVKFVITNTETIYEAKKIVRQTFSDYHISLMKPNASISLYFDSSTTYGRLMNQLMDIEIKGKPMHSWVASKGKVTGHQAWTLSQFASFIHCSLGTTKGELTKDLLDDSVYNRTYSLLVDLIPMLIEKLPLDSLLTEKKGIHKQALFTKALFLTGYGYLIRSAIEDSLVTGAFNMDAFDKLSSLPLTDMSDESFVIEKITKEEGGIVSASDKRIGSYLCGKLRIMPCKVLTA